MPTSIWRVVFVVARDRVRAGLGHSRGADILKANLQAHRGARPLDVGPLRRLVIFDEFVGDNVGNSGGLENAKSITN